MCVFIILNLVQIKSICKKSWSDKKKNYKNIYLFVAPVHTSKKISVKFVYIYLRTYVNYMAEFVPYL